MEGKTQEKVSRKSVVNSSGKSKSVRRSLRIKSGSLEGLFSPFCQDTFTQFLQGPLGDTGATGTAGSRGPKGREGRFGFEGERGEDGDLVKKTRSSQILARYPRFLDYFFV